MTDRAVADLGGSPVGSSRSRPSPSDTGASCTSTATGCSPRSTRPRTRCRRRSCGRGGRASQLRRRRAVPGVALPDRDERVPRQSCAGTPRRLTRCGRSPRCRGCSRTPTGCSTRSRRPTTSPTRWPSSGRRSSSPSWPRSRSLPPRQRAALVVRDVLGWPASETATAARHERARREQRPPAGADDDAGAAPGTPHGLVGRRTERRGARPARGFIDAHERCDAALAIAIAAQDLRITMPPYPHLFDGSRSSGR